MSQVTELSSAEPVVVVVMGVSGTGKTSIGIRLAERLRVEFADADDFHSAANIAKMAAGTPLSDEDRRPWLDAVGSWLQARSDTGAVAACSALRRHYRDLLREHAPSLRLLHLDGSRELISGRVRRRSHLFMPASLLESQLAALERPGTDEPAVCVDASLSPEAIVDTFLEAIGRSGHRSQ